MYWGKPPQSNGKTWGNYCGYCMKYFKNRVSKTMRISLPAYEAWLGEDPERVKKHMAVVQVIVKDLKQKGGSLRAHFDWVETENRALHVTHKKETVIKRPGYSHVEWNYYTSINGSLYENGKMNEGHREYYQDGVRGVLIPDAPVTRIEFNEAMSAELRAQVSIGAHQRVG